MKKKQTLYLAGTPKVVSYSNVSFWLQTAPLFSAAALDLPPQAEIAILGAGIMGSALAYWLARAGQRPLVLERNAHPAGGATGRNGGLLVSGPSQPYHVAIEKLGRIAAREVMRATLLNQQLLEEVLARESIEANYARTGFLALGSTSPEVAGLQASVRELGGDGFAAEWLDRTAMIEKLGTTPGPEYVGALFKPDDGKIHSARYAFGVARAAQQLGARFAFGAPAQRVEPGPGGQGWRIRSDRGNVIAEQLVIALNAWAGDLFPELRELIVPTRGHILLTAPVDFKLTPWVANEGWDYGRQLETGQLLVGGQRICRPDLDRGHAPPPGENVPPIQPEVIAALRSIVPKLFPAATKAPIARCWTGTMAFTPDQQPLVGQWPGREGLWLLAGFSGHGMPFSQVMPGALAARLTGSDGPAIPAAFNPAHFLGRGTLRVQV